ncbi:MAG TPA: HAD family hydrolase [Phycisphaerales bacterium]|nr:HAD family hydrolase [Phycisphaerales bacterium]
MLILFDIDMTLITSGGSGMKAMVEAGQELFGPGFHAEGVSFAGSLDPVIFSQMLRRHGQPDTPEVHARWRSLYARKLEARLRTPGIARALPGVMELLDEVERSHATMGLLTGNFEETGSLKLRAAGIDPERFAVRVWGDESPHEVPRRQHLVRVGMERGCAVRGAEIARESVVVIGDTPNDVECALAHGCRCLGVATGRSSAAELIEAGATHAVEDLSDTRGVLRWLGLIS